MHRIEVKRHLAPEDVGAVADLLRVAEATDGHRPLGEHKWLDLVQGGREGFAGLVAWDPDHDHLVGYAQLSRGPASGGGASSGLEVVADPQQRGPGNPVGLDLV